MNTYKKIGSTEEARQIKAIYLASRYSRKAELVRYREQLLAAGHVVTSSWLDGDYPTGEDGRSLEAPLPERSRVAMLDLNDVIDAEVVISFTEAPRSGGRGGRHVEFGVAVANKAQLVVIGPREHVFHCLEGVEQFDTWEQFVLQGGLID